MSKMPVCQMAIVCRVLAERAQEDSILECGASDSKGLEEFRYFAAVGLRIASATGDIGSLRWRVVRDARGSLVRYNRVTCLVGGCIGHDWNGWTWAAWEQVQAEWLRSVERKTEVKK